MTASFNDVKKSAPWLVPADQMVSDAIAPHPVCERLVVEFDKVFVNLVADLSVAGTEGLVRDAVDRLVSWSCIDGSAQG